jgi:hypothetical protein
VHVGSAQALPVHTPLAQSAASVHDCPAPHVAQVVPPQSMSVSAAFFTPSVHVATWHVLVVVPVQTPVTQSDPAEQPLVVAHLAQVPPPQSVSVSAPFLTPSLQVGAAQVPPVQILLRQSVPALQVAPLGQPLHAPPPPQSMPVSVPFETPSLHVGARHTFGVPEHTWLVQSLPAPQVCPVAHAPQVLPPQSTAVSLPF